MSNPHQNLDEWKDACDQFEPDYAALWEYLDSPIYDLGDGSFIRLIDGNTFIHKDESGDFQVEYLPGKELDEFVGN